MVTKHGSAQPALAADAMPHLASFDQVVALIRQNRDMKLLVEVETTLRLARYSPGRIEFAPTPQAPRDLAARLGLRLQSWTGQRWAVSVVAEAGAATIAEANDAGKLALVAEAGDYPMVQAILAAFPGAEITDIRQPETMAAAALSALPEVDEEWDPFEDD